MSLGYPTVSRVTGTVCTETAQAITVNLQVWSEAEDQVPSAARMVMLVLTTDAAGQALETATSAMAAGTDGTLLLLDTGVTYAFGITEADGDLDVVVTDTGTSTIYLQVWSGGVILNTFTLPFA